MLAHKANAQDVTHQLSLKADTDDVDMRLRDKVRHRHTHTHTHTLATLPQHFHTSSHTCQGSPQMIKGGDRVLSTSPYYASSCLLWFSCCPIQASRKLLGECLSSKADIATVEQRVSELRHRITDLDDTLNRKTDQTKLEVRGHTHTHTHTHTH